MRAALALAIASLALVGASPAAQAKSKPCSRKGSHSIVSTKSVRVYRVKNSDGNYDLFGCVRSNGRRQKLEHGYDDMIETSGTFDRVHVAGHFVAWQFTAYDVSCKAACPPGYDPTAVTLRVRDLKKRKTRDVRGDPFAGRSGGGGRGDGVRGAGAPALGCDGRLLPMLILVLLGRRLHCRGGGRGPAHFAGRRRRRFTASGQTVRMARFSALWMYAAAVL